MTVYVWSQLCPAYDSLQSPRRMTKAKLEALRITKSRPECRLTVQTLRMTSPVLQSAYDKPYDSTLTLRMTIYVSGLEPAYD